jgi:cytochrome P450
LQHFLTGLFGVNGEEHRRQRRLLMPAFHRERLETYASEMVRITHSYLVEWQPGSTRDISADMQFLTMRIATQTLFGEDVGQDGAATATLLRDTLRINSRWLTAALPWDLPGLPYRRLLNKAAAYEVQMRRIVQQKRATGPGTTDVLSILLQAEDADTGTSLTENEVLGHVGVLFAAGHETSANAVTWTLFLLSQHPEVAAQLVDELDGVLRGADPGAADLGRLPLMEYVVKEAMRVLPPVPWNARVLLGTAEVGGYQLPAGAEVWISIFETHRCPALFPEPAKFRPSRWESLDPGPFEYVPFSAGPRMCIGAGFAMMEIRLILAMVLKRFRLEMAEGVCLDRAGIVVLAPKNGLPMKIYRQDRRFGDGAAKVRGNIGELVELPS